MKYIEITSKFKNYKKQCCSVVWVKIILKKIISIKYIQPDLVHESIPSFYANDIV